MGIFEVLAVLLTCSAIFSFVNHRYLGLPTTIGLMAMALVLSLCIMLVVRMHPPWQDEVGIFLGSIDFNKTLLHGMLGFLLFAGALNLDLSELRQHKVLILILATIGVLISSAVVALATRYVLSWLGIHLDWIHCFLFGALISPTDPIAVLAILKSLGAPKDLEVQMAGESLFNDGVGVVVFLTLLQIAGAGHGQHGDAGAIEARAIVQLFVQEVIGGALLGFVLGWLAYRMLKQVDNYQVEILISLALVSGGYALADRLHLSGPIGMVVAGLLIGNHGRTLAMSKTTCEHLDVFWELVDEILNAILFVLIGFEVLVLKLGPNSLLAALLIIPVVLLARCTAVGLPSLALHRVAVQVPHAVILMTWGGLRGGISVALALSLRQVLPASDSSSVDLILVMTYVVVTFSIIVQGLSVGKLVRRLLQPAD